MHDNNDIDMEQKSELLKQEQRVDLQKQKDQFRRQFGSIYVEYTQMQRFALKYQDKVKSGYVYKLLQLCQDQQLTYLIMGMSTYEVISYDKSKRVSDVYMKIRQLISRVRIERQTKQRDQMKISFKNMYDWIINKFK